MCERRNSRKAPSLIRPRLVEPGHDLVVAVGGAALVHHLGLALRVKILRDQTDDAKDFALPGFQARGRLFEEVKDVFLRQFEERPAALLVQLRRGFLALGRDGAPEVVVDAVLMLPAFVFAPLLGAQVRLLLAGVAMDAVAHQSVRGVDAAAPPPRGRAAPRSP